VIVAGCDDEVRWVDPDVTLDGGGSGPGGLAVGFLDNHDPPVFTELSVDPTLVVVNGLQGGTWTMPTLRIDGPIPSARISCEVTVKGGEVVGVLATQARTSPLGDGHVDIPYLPIPIRHAPPRATAPIGDLEGARADFDCRVEAGGGRASAHYEVTLDVP